MKDNQDMVMCILLLNNIDSIKVMEEYSSASFFQCFTQLSREVGYPQKLLPE